MAAITISIPEHLKEWIDEQVSEGRFPDEESVIVDAVEQAMIPGYRWDLDPEVDAALAQIERGEGMVITDLAAYFDRVTQEAEVAARGEVVRADVKACASRKGSGMQTHIAPIKENGDITLPDEVRRRIEKVSNVEFIIRDDGVIELRRPSLSLDDVFGILPPLEHASPDFDKEIERAIEEHVARKWGSQPR